MTSVTFNNFCVLIFFQMYIIKAADQNTVQPDIEISRKAFAPELLSSRT